MKYFVHNIFAVASSAPIISFYVKLFTLILCLVGSIYTSPFTRYIISPVCPCQYSRVAYEASAYHLNTIIPPMLKASLNPHVILRYSITRLISLQ